MNPMVLWSSSKKICCHDLRICLHNRFVWSWMGWWSSNSLIVGIPVSIRELLEARLDIFHVAQGAIGWFKRFFFFFCARHASLFGSYLDPIVHWNWICCVAEWTTSNFGSVYTIIHTSFLCVQPWIRNHHLDLLSSASTDPSWGACCTRW